MNSQRTLSGLTVGDFDELVVEDNFSLLGTFKAGTIQATGDVTCGTLTASGVNTNTISVNSGMSSINSAGDISGASLDTGNGTIQTTGTVSGGTLSALLGNVTSVNTNNINVNSGSATINSDGAIVGVSVNAGSGTIQTNGSILGGAISGASLNTGSGTIQTTGTIQGGAITGNSVNTGTGTIQTTGNLQGGAITGTSLSAGSGTISTTGALSGGTLGVAEGLAGIDANGDITGAALSAGSGTITTTGTITGGAVTSTNSLTGDNVVVGGSVRINSGGGFSGASVGVTGQVTAGSLALDSAAPTLTATYPGATVTCTNLNLLSASNRILPTGVYYQSGHYYMALNSGGWRSNDDNSYYNVHIEDDEANNKVFGRARVATSVLEMVQVVQIPQNWRATAVYVEVRNSAGSSLTRDVNAYKINNFDAVGFSDLGEGTSGNELTLDTDGGYMDGTQYHAMMVVLHTTSGSDYAGGGYVKMSYITD